MPAGDPEDVLIATCKIFEICRQDAASAKICFCWQPSRKFII